MRRLLRTALATAAAPLLLTGCAGSDSTDSAAMADGDTTAAASSAASAAEQAGAQQGTEFQYDGELGPATWSTLSPEWGACADTSAQSPIDLHDATPADLPPLEFDYRPGDIALKNTTHTVQANETPGSEVVVDNKHFPLTQFHLHEPSEHELDGIRHDAELHLVHTADDGSITVVGVLIDKGAPNAALGNYFDELPAVGDTAELDDFDPSQLLPADLTNVRYSGSLTTPPCTEGVQWIVMTTPVQASAEQLDEFRTVIEQNARPLQEQGSRSVLLDTEGR
ncbi:carbonic anhydrase family protein [Rhodococcus sp. IEGM 1370]|uniref:carbonic anhydrase n=1 Tax=unclassified Rhodococcus (in: high G+C Gram-positive bacteria) TaxID=192944 RepID=UPI00165DE298|nr:MULTISPECIES: carbonic anhydrase family protein [unclassified Rhodococcus (in: high G+C Gram-positive bacteria)]MDV8079659.1 carbonic anhydrase family protein [Rhodococcus sp. IEGM 1370]